MGLLYILFDKYRMPAAALSAVFRIMLCRIALNAEVLFAQRGKFVKIKITGCRNDDIVGTVQPCFVVHQRFTGKGGNALLRTEYGQGKRIAFIEFPAKRFVGKILG